MKRKPTASTPLLPPFALEIEAAVINHAITEPEILEIILGELKPDYFYKPAHSTIFECIQAMHREQKPVDLVTLENTLSAKGVLPTVGGVNYLAEISRAGISSSNIDYYCQVIRECAALRNVIEKSALWSASAYERPDIFDLMGTIEQDLSQLHDMSFSSAGFSVASLSSQVLETIKTRKDQGGVTGVNTGLSDLNEITAGWQPSDLIILAARPSMGKTALMLECAGVAGENSIPVGIISLEMSADQLTQRLLVQSSGVNGEKVRLGRLNNLELVELEKAQKRLQKASIYINDTPTLSIAEIVACGRRWAREKRIGLLVVDYLQLATADRAKNDNREQEISAISRGLKGLAKSLNIPVIALSQLSRAVEVRGGDKRPQLSDLRESGSIEQDADMVIFLYRPEYYGIQRDENGDSNDGVAELIVAKQRNGRVGSCRAFYDKPTMRFRDLAKVSDQSPLGSYYETEKESVF